MTLTLNIILLVFFCITNTWTHGQVELESNDLSQDDNRLQLLYKNYISSLLSENNLRDGEKVRVQLYYESLNFYCMNFYRGIFMGAVNRLRYFIDVQAYPFGNTKIIHDNGEVKFQCPHGPDECYGNKLHACVLDYFGDYSMDGLIFNDCLMSLTEKGSFGSDDETADKCGKIVGLDTEPIKDCAKGTRGTELMLLYGEHSKRANFSFVPHLVINGKMSSTWNNNLKDEICAAFTNPPPVC